MTRKGKDIAKIVACRDLNADLVREGAAEYRSGGGLVTYEQLLAEQRYELIDGVIYNLASPSYKHHHAVHELHGVFYIWFRGKGCTPPPSPLDITIRKSGDIVNNNTYLKSADQEVSSYLFDGLQVALRDIFG